MFFKFPPKQRFPWERRLVLHMEMIIMLFLGSFTKFPLVPLFREFGAAILCPRRWSVQQSTKKAAIRM